MNHNNVVAIDLATKKFHLVILDKTGKKIASKKLLREDLLPYISEISRDSIIIAMEACGGSNYWSQSFIKLGFAVKLIKTKDVKAYAKSRQKNDLNDALAIAKACFDPELKAVMPKDKKTQEVILLHRLRKNAIKVRIIKTNALMSSLLEFGYLSNLSKGRFGKVAADEITKAYKAGFISKEIANIFTIEAKEISLLYKKELALDHRIIAINSKCEKAKNLLTIPGIGPINASILSCLAMESCRDAKEFAASLGLVPKQSSTGGNIVLGRITKQGNRYARTMLIQGARSVVMRAKSAKNNGEDKLIIWSKKLLKTKAFNKVCVALANKLARIAYSVSVKNRVYNNSF
jgi:transposase